MAALRLASESWGSAHLCAAATAPPPSRTTGPHLRQVRKAPHSCPRDTFFLTLSPPGDLRDPRHLQEVRGAVGLALGDPLREEGLEVPSTAENVRPDSLTFRPRGLRESSGKGCPSHLSDGKTLNLLNLVSSDFGGFRSCPIEGIGFATC